MKINKMYWTKLKMKALLKEVSLFFGKFFLKKRYRERASVCLDKNSLPPLHHNCESSTIDFFKKNSRFINRNRSVD